MNFNLYLKAVVDLFITPVRKSSLMFISDSASSGLLSQWVLVVFTVALPHCSLLFVCADQHLNIKVVWTAHSEAQPAHPLQLDFMQSGREELLRKQTTGGAWHSGEWAVSWRHVRTRNWPLIDLQNHLYVQLKWKWRIHWVIFRDKTGKPLLLCCQYMAGFSHSEHSL